MTTTPHDRAVAELLLGELEHVYYDCEEKSDADPVSAGACDVLEPILQRLEAVAGRTRPQRR